MNERNTKLMAAYAKNMLIGIAVSPGVGIGTAYCIHDIPISPVTKRLDEDTALTVLAQLEEACRATASDLKSMHEKAASQIGQHEAALFQAHASILQDAALRDKIRQAIVEQRTSAQEVLRVVLDKYKSLFSRARDAHPDVPDENEQVDRYQDVIAHSPGTVVTIGMLHLDGDNRKVSHSCDSLNPSVMKVLDSDIESCCRADKPVSVCGEMAGRRPGFFCCWVWDCAASALAPHSLQR